jgi:hypothetical protein
VNIGMQWRSKLVNPCIFMLLWKPSTFKSPHCPFQGKGRIFYRLYPTVSALTISLGKKRQRTLNLSKKILAASRGRSFNFLAGGGGAEGRSFRSFGIFLVPKPVPQVTNVFSEFSICSPISHPQHLPNSTSLYPCDVTILDAATALACYNSSVNGISISVNKYLRF